MEYELWQDGTGSFLKMQGSGRETMADQMFIYQKIPGFLPMEIRWIDGIKEYVYDISGRISLALYMSQYPINKEKMCGILKEILMLSETAQEYLLDGNGVVCQEEYLYFNKDTQKIEGIYQEDCPLGGMKNLRSLTEFFINEMDGKDEELALFLYGFHQCLSEAGITRQSLFQYIEQERTKVVEKKNPIEEVTMEQPIKYKKQESAENLSEYMVAIALLAAGIGLTFLAWTAGWFREDISGATNYSLGIGASVFFLGVAGYGAWRVWPKSVKVHNQACLEEEKPRSACLISCQGRIRSIPIAHYPFTLGCEESSVDGVVMESGIEKIHACIMWEGDNMYVLDEESEKGTFRNNERLVPWQKKCLKDGDVLRLATTEFVVEIN